MPEAVVLIANFVKFSLLCFATHGTLPNASHPCFYTGTHHVVNLTMHVNFTMYDLYGDRDHT